MFKSYLTTALRMFRKKPVYAVINVASLALGIAGCLLIAILLRHEYSFDRFHENADRIYQVYVHEARPGDPRYIADTPMPLAPTLSEALPQVESVVRWSDGSATMRVEDRRFAERVHFTDAAFFDLFSFSLIEGTPAQALNQRDGVVITAPVAERLFGGATALGRTVDITLPQGTQAFVVTGVAAEPPSNSSFDFDVVLRFEQHPAYSAHENNWHNYAHAAYALLRPGTDVAGMTPALTALVRTHLQGYLTHLNERFQPEGSDTDVLQLGLQPLIGARHDTRFNDTVNPIYLWALALVALLVLGSGVVNFVNLTTGQAATRLREVGVRKALGATRRQVRAQSWFDTGVLCILALLIGVALAEFALPGFAEFIGEDLHLHLTPFLLLVMVGLWALTTLLAGAYPSFYLARFQAIEVLKGETRLRGPGWMRNGLTVFQFALVILLVSCALVMSHQMRFLQNQDPGFDEAQVVTFNLPHGVHSDAVIPRLRNVLAPHPHIASVSAASNTPGIGPDGSRSRSVTTFGYYDTEISVHRYDVAADYVETMGLRLKEGRTLDPSLPAHRNLVLINEAMAARLRDRPIVGSHINGFSIGGDTTAQVIGIVEDFHFESLHTAVEPVAISVNPERPLHQVLVRIAPEEVPATLAALEEAWATVLPDAAFNYSFLDDNIDRQYRSEEKQIQLATGSAGFAVLIACLGLFGLAVLGVARRRKEIGIRKVLGASVISLIGLLSSIYVRLVAVAFVLVVPLAWWGMSQWLQSYAFRVSLAPWWFVLAGSTALAIALITVGFCAWRAAARDPVKALRYE